MNIPDEMLMAAITKTVEAGLLPRRSFREELAEARQLMRDILGAALKCSAPVQPATPSLYRRTTRSTKAMQETSPDC
jgi:hypothetical protein